MRTEEEAFHPSPVTGRGDSVKRRHGGAVGDRFNSVTNCLLLDWTWPLTPTGTRSVKSTFILNPIAIRTETHSDQKTICNTEGDTQRSYDCNLLGTGKFPTIEITGNPTACTLQAFTYCPSKPVVSLIPGVPVSQIVSL
jgi:hypothetical protein